VADAVSNYLTLEEARESIQIPTTAVDTELQLAIDAAEAAIEAYCGRVFTLSASEARRFTASSPTRVSLDDVTSVSAVAVDLDGDGTHETTISAGSWELLPFSAAASGRPYRALQLRPSATARFPRWPGGVRVTGTWGWPAVPPAVKLATQIQAWVLLRQSTTVLVGVDEDVIREVGDNRFASRFLDRQVQLLLAAYRRVRA
jgi:hypothetical protein